MPRIEDLKMQSKLAAVLALPLLALAVFTGHALVREFQHQAGIAELAQAGELTQAIGNLVHELQSERGRTGVFLARQGRLFGTELASQRAATDAAWRALEGLQGHDRRQAAARGHLAERRAELVRLRAQVDRLAVPAVRAVENYSLAIRDFMGILEDLSGSVADVEVTRQLASYRQLVEAKEAAGQERAEGGQRLAGTTGTERRLMELATTQAVLLDQFLIHAPEPLRRAWRDAAQAECVRDLPALRARALAAQPGARPSPEAWFDTTSCRLERLHDLESAYALHITAHTRALHAEGRLRLMLIIAVALLPILPSAWLILRVVRNMSGNSRWLLTAMHGIAGGDFNVSLPPPSRDELGELARGLDNLRNQLARHVAEQERMLARERDTAAELNRRSLEVRRFAQRIAGGDLAGRLDEGEDTLGQLTASLNQMAQGLTSLAGRVRETSTALVTTATELQGAVSAQSAGATEQAASVSQTMTTLEQIRVTTGQTQDKAQLLGEMAERARSEGERGRQAVEESIGGIGQVSDKVDTIAHTILSLNEQTQRVGEITGAVAAIARQLRLLSLNAAIEATKAGEAGQGFAVVAAEVKQLAEQSQSSTEQVQHILEDIRHATDRAVMATEDGAKGAAHGLELVRRAGEVIRGLEQVVRDTSLASRQIVAAVRQEAAGIEQIATAMGDIHKVTSQFVAATEQTRAASGELTHLAQQLSAAASSYKV